MLKTVRQRIKISITNVKNLRNILFHITPIKLIGELIIKLIKVGLGIRDLVIVLEFSTTIIFRRIVLIARKINKPLIFPNRIYEVDEMRCYLRRKTREINL